MLQGRMGKIVLVVLGVLLMLVFILPSGLNQMSGNNPVVGTAGGEDIHLNEVRQAGASFGYARSMIQVPNGQGGYVSLADALLPQQAETLEKEPDLFYLLLREAQQNGLSLPREQVREFLEQVDAHVMVEDRSAPDGRVLVPFAEIPGQQIRENVLAAAADVLDVFQSARRSADVLKISAPVVSYHMALEQQQADVATVVVSADEFISQVPEPSEEAVREQFEQYKDELPGMVSAENPFGFGYRRPDRIKFQYLTIPQAAVEQQVRQGLLDQPIREREQTLYRYWRDNRARFPVPPGSPATQPTTGPSTQAAAEPATQPAEGGTLLATPGSAVEAFLSEQTQQITGKTGETDWRQFVAVHDDVVEQYLETQVNDLEAQVTKRTRDILSADFRTHDVSGARAGGAGQTRVGVAVTDPSYLEKVADLVAEEFGIRPAVSSYGREFLSRLELASEQEVGPIANAAWISGFNAIQFDVYAINATLPLLSEEERALIEPTGRGLKLYQPSEVFSDLSGNDYIFRVTEAAPDSAPAEVAEVAEEVRQDLKTEAAYEQALARAREISEAARGSSLTAAASERRVHDPEPFIPAMGPAQPEAFGLADAAPSARAGAAEQIAKGLFELLADGAEGPQVGVVAIPAVGTAVVTQLQDLQATWSDDQSLAVRRAAMREQLAQRALLETQPLETFFDRERVEERLNYESEE